MSEISQIREIIRQDLDSVGLIPTGKGIEMLANGDQAILYGLMCEAIYVRIYNGRDLEDVFMYLTGPMCLEPEVAHKFIMSALTVRMLLSKNSGNQAAALKTLMEKKQEQERPIVEAIIEACVRTSNEYNISWSTDFNHLMEEMLESSNTSSGKGCLIVIAIGLILITTLLYFIFWR